MFDRVQALSSVVHMILDSASLSTVPLLWLRSIIAASSDKLVFAIKFSKKSYISDSNLFCHMTKEHKYTDVLISSQNFPGLSSLGLLSC